MDRKLGWKKDKYDKRDYLHRKLAPPLIPDKYSLVEYAPEVRDQGYVGSCVGFGIGGNLTGLANMVHPESEWFSPTWIYNGARFIEGTLNEDIGCYPRDALEWALDKGCLLEHFWPYDLYELDTAAPPSSLDPEAAKWPLLAYYRVADGVDGICSAIASGHFVSIGTPWFEAWMDTDPNGKLAEVTDEDYVAGGHETLLYGYDRTTGYFQGINSWGKEWGQQGFFQIPFSAFNVFKALGGYDAHYVAVEWATEPEPPTPPDPEPEKKLPWWAWALIGAGALALLAVWIF